MSYIFDPLKKKDIFWTDVYFTDQNRTDPKNRKTLITQERKILSYPNLSQAMSISIKTLWQNFMSL